MFPLKVLPALVASICVAGAIAPATLAQTATTTGLTGIESQPVTPDDLAIDNLTPEQEAQLITIFETYQPQIETAMAGYLNALSVLNDLLAPTTPDLAISNARADVVAAEQTVDDLVFERNMAIRNVLTIEQRQVINDALRALAGIGPAEPMAVFPQNLIGMDMDAAMSALEADGWELVIETPSSLGYDRGSDELNLDINRNGQVSAAELVE